MAVARRLQIYAAKKPARADDDNPKPEFWIAHGKREVIPTMLRIKGLAEDAVDALRGAADDIFPDVARDRAETIVDIVKRWQAENSK